MIHFYKHGTIILLTHKASCYKLFKSNIVFETYLTNPEKKHWLPLLFFRLSNHYLPNEKGRLGKKKSLANRICALCTYNEIGDEFHYLMCFCFCF